MKRRLLIFVQDAGYFLSHRLPLAQELSRRGWAIHVAAPPNPEARARIEAMGMHFNAVPLTRGFRNPVAEFRALCAIFAMVWRLRPDLLHLVSIKPIIWGGLAARVTGVPAVVHAITGLGFLFIRGENRAGLLRRIVEWLYALALGHRNSVAIFQNGDDLALFRERRMVRPDSWRMIRGCGVDMTVFRATPEPSVDAENPPVVMFPARLLGDKGVHEFVGAAERLKAAGHAARFVLVGRRDPDNPTDIGETRLQDWLARGIVEHWGYAEDMPATFARAHVVVLPSYREGLPRSLIEAAACARAIVTTDVPGCREVVRHDENGLLVPLRDAEATAAAIARLIGDGALRRRLAARGRAIAENEFSVGHFVDESLEAYRGILSRAGIDL